MTAIPQASDEDEQPQTSAVVDQEAAPAPLQGQDSPDSQDQGSSVLAPLRDEADHPDSQDQDPSTAATRRRDSLRKEIRAGWQRALKH